jgi:pimeloyl-ACP methyl ester carboxylesterase
VPVPSLETDDGRVLAWREAGSGPPLLCHCGGPGFSSLYFGDLPELAAERTLLLLDPRGTGDSSRPADASAYDLEDYVADIEALREHLGLDRFDLLGHSHGGFVAIVWAGTHPDRVGRLVLASTATRFTDEIRARRMEPIATHQGRPYFEDSIAALQDQQAGNYASDEELVALYERAGRVLMPLGTDIEPIARTLVAAGMNSDALRHFNETVAGGMDLRPYLPRIEARTLVLCGDHDAFGGPAAEEIAEGLPDSTSAVVPGDHFTFLEPENRPAWSRAVIDFLGASPG